MHVVCWRLAANPSERLERTDRVLTGLLGELRLVTLSRRDSLVWQAVRILHELCTGRRRIFHQVAHFLHLG